MILIGGYTYGPSAPKPMNYQKVCIIGYGMYYMKLIVSSRLQTKEGIKSCLLFSLPAHLLKMALVFAQSLYELERTLCTYNHTVLFKNTTHFYHLLERWRHHFRFIIRVNLLKVPSSRADLLLYHPYNLSISTFK